MRTVLLLGWFVAVTAFGGNVWGDPKPNPPESESTTSTTTDAGTDGGTVVPTWREDKLVLTVDPSYSALPYAKQALEAAVLAWTSVASELPEVEIVEPIENSNALILDANNTEHRISFATEGEPRAHNALAITLLTTNEGTASILDADVIVNNGHCLTDVTTYPDTSQRSGVNVYDLQNVLTHELGHWFGLGENYDNPEATMYAYVVPFETKKRDLAQEDLAAVQLAYWHADNPSENTGCAVRSPSLPKSANGLGCLAVALFLLRRSNRPRCPHLRSNARRLDPTTTQIGRGKAS